MGSYLETSFLETRKETTNLSEKLSIEDHMLQCHEDVSPTKWHLAHTTWFFDEFILKKFEQGYAAAAKEFSYLFNSYYQSCGEFFNRNLRGQISRPSLEEVYYYRQKIDDRMAKVLQNPISKELEKLIELGIHHEMQHQELIVMDIKYNFFQNPCHPVFQKDLEDFSNVSENSSFIKLPEKLVKVGQSNKESFAFDNEMPPHKYWLESYLIENKPVLSGEYLQFINSDGYSNPKLWLSDGWDWLQQNQIKHPLYWILEKDKWSIFTLSGKKILNKRAPVTHVSFYEADAYCRFMGYRLPTEFEWEHASTKLQYVGLGWEWTQSAYLPYPGFQTLYSGLGEYNGKFMNNQRVLRGYSPYTPKAHRRMTYRNYFYPEKRWPFTVFRVAKNP